MLIIPAIDLKDGQCVRLRQGRWTTAPSSPMTRWRWRRAGCEAGCRRLHLVDLNGAFAGEPVNGAVVTRDRRGVSAAADTDRRRHPHRCETIEHYLDAGVQLCDHRHQAVKEPEFVAEACAAFPGKRHRRARCAKTALVATDGWAEVSRGARHRSGARFEADGVAAIVYTDIARDGMMQGVNVQATVALAQAVAHPGDRLRRRHQHRGHRGCWRAKPRSGICRRHHRPRDLRGHAGPARGAAPGATRRRGRLSMGLAKRIIPCLDVDNGRVVKGVQLRRYPRCRRPGGNRHALQRAGRRRGHLPRYHRQPRGPRHHARTPWSTWPSRCSFR